jgi:hypothetical protein
MTAFKYEARRQGSHHLAPIMKIEWLEIDNNEFE